MIKMHCDRCGKEIEGTTYYTVRIYGNDINPKSDYSVATATAIQNSNTNLMALFNAEKQYCKQCRDEIETFISCGKDTNPKIEQALDLAWQSAQIDGGHHKMWVIDQMVRVLCGSEEEQEKWVGEYIGPDEDGDCYSWDCGIAP